MKYILLIFMIISAYYTFTYGLTLYEKEKNPLGGFAVIMLAVIGTIIPIIVLFQK